MNGLPDRIARYRVRSVLGIGGFGIVVCALDEALDAQVALKILAPEHAQDPTVRDRFLREGQLLRRVRNAHVIGVHDIGELDDGRPYLVMELASGGVLGDRIAPGQPADAAGVRATITALASGLGALHAAGIVHRDVTPANLLVVDHTVTVGEGSQTVRRTGLLAANERVVIADLGLAKDQERTTAGPTILGGTPHFRSPEQTRRGEAIGPEADVYGATGVLWYLLTGDPPGYEAALEAQLEGVPSGWRHVLGRGLAVDPSARFSTMAEWEIAALEAVEGHAGTHTMGFRVAAPGATCPYKGLTSFQPEDSAFFFGREAMVDELVARLQASSTLVIGGPSGSGKSSLLRAGLVPAISNGALPGSQHWPVALFSPGAAPLAELVHQLGRLFHDQTLTVDELRTDPSAAERWVVPGSTGLVAIDQFEEVFTHGADAGECRTMFEVLDALTRSQDAHLRVVIALRSDFYSTCAGHPWLADRISHNQILVGPMQRLELRRAIEGPAQRAGLRLESGLAEAFLDEAGDEPGGLPLLEHALMETWMRRRGTVLTLDGFRAAGGVIGAIAQSAEHAYERLDGSERARARRLFLRLVTPGEDAPDTRRRLTWDDLEHDAPTSQLVHRLATDRLLTVDDRGVELVHETLIRSWPRLRDWIEESREDLRMRQAVTRAAAEWETEGRDPDLLYRGGRLAALLEWHERSDLELSDGSAAFLEAGRTARDAEEAADTRAAQRRHRARRIAFGVVSLLAVAALTASLVAFTALRRSQDKEAEAEDLFARGLATQAESLASTRPKLALALAAESIARVRPTPAAAQRAIVTARLALAASDIVPRSDPIPVGDTLTVLVTPDGSTMATGSREGTIRLWDTGTGEVTATLSGPSAGIEEAAVDPGGRWLVAAGSEGLWRWDIRSGATRGDLVGRPTGELWSVAFSPDGERLATASEDGVVEVYDTSSWKPTGAPLTGDIDLLSVAFTRDGKRVLAGSGDGRVFLWDLATRTRIGSPIAAHGTNDVWELVVSPDGRRLATASSDGTTRVWSLESRQLVATPFRGGDSDGDESIGGISGLVWSVDGESLYASADDGRVHEWGIDARSESDTSAIGHDDRVTDASASADGTILATLGRDQDVRLWDIADRRPTVRTLQRLDVPLHGLAITPDATQIAVGDDRGVVHVYAAGRAPTELRGHRSRVFGLAFLPGGRLVSGDDDGEIRLWDVGSGRLVASHDRASPGGITSIAVGPRGDRFATSGADGTVRLWSSRSLDEPIAETIAVRAGAYRSVFTPSGDLVAAYGDGFVRFWAMDGTERRPPLKVDRDGDAVFSVAISPDGRMLAAATTTDGVTLWDLADGRPRPELNGQAVGPVDVAFTPDGSALGVATRSGVTMLWSSLTGEAIGPRFHYHSDAVWRVVMSASSALIAASEDGTVSRLDALDPSRACDQAAGALDRRARTRYLGDRRPIGCRR